MLTLRLFGEIWLLFQDQVGEGAELSTTGAIKTNSTAVKVSLVVTISNQQHHTSFLRKCKSHQHFLTSIFAEQVVLIIQTKMKSVKTSSKKNQRKFSLSLHPKTRKDSSQKSSKWNRKTLRPSCSTLTQKKKKKKTNRRDRHVQSAIGFFLNKANISLHTRCHKIFAQCMKCLGIQVGVKTLKNHECKEKKQFKCSQCHKYFHCKSKVAQHEQIHDEKNFVACPHCTKKYVKARLQQHITYTHTCIKNFICDHCDFKGKNKLQMKQHVLKHMKHRPMVCKVCNKGFIELRYFREHKLNHIIKNPFKCDKCGKGYTRKTSIIRHMQTAHSTIRNFKCKQCKYAGKTKDDLTTHIMSHTHAYICDICKRTFSRSSLLKEHRILHEKPNAYQCKICKMMFAQKKTLKDHMVKHRDGKPIRIIENQLSCRHKKMNKENN
jgi:hypothetical protein